MTLCENCLPITIISYRIRPNIGMGFRIKMQVMWINVTDKIRFLLLYINEEQPLPPAFYF